MKLRKIAATFCQNGMCADREVTKMSLQKRKFSCRSLSKFPEAKSEVKAILNLRETRISGVAVYSLLENYNFFLIHH